MIPEATHKAIQQDTERNRKGDLRETMIIKEGNLKETTTISRRIPNS